jgi:HlyD family secretion protein
MMAHVRRVVPAAVVVGLILGMALLSARLAARPHSNTLAVSGNIEAHESVLSFKAVQSRLVALPFDEGQWVDVGMELARLDDQDYRQQVAVAEAALRVRQEQVAAAAQRLEAARKTLLVDEADLAQKELDYRRAQALWENHVISTYQRDLAETALKQSRAVHLRDQALEAAAEQDVTVAEANVRNAQESLKLEQIVLGYTTLYAPFSGVILVRNAELGEQMQPGTPVFTLADLDHVWLRAYINETDVGRIRFGQSAVVKADSYPDHTYAGRISLISSNAEFTPKSVETHAERVTLVYRIKIDIDNPTHELKPGMPADATLEPQAAGS